MDASLPQTALCLSSMYNSFTTALNLKKSGFILASNFFVKTIKNGRSQILFNSKCE
jgi:hypothetical protein